MKAENINNKMRLNKTSLVELNYSELQLHVMNTIHGGTISISKEVGSSLVGNTYENKLKTIK